VYGRELKKEKSRKEGVNFGNEDMIEFGDKGKGLEFKKVVGFQRVWACVDSTYKI
jgi:hypothetical protein